MKADPWETWWKARGSERLGFLLWAVCDPLGGGVPFDEYDSYCAEVVQILRESWEDDERHPERSQNERFAAARRYEELLVSRLSMMVTGGKLEDDRRAASKLIDWYDWEMDGSRPDLHRWRAARYVFDVC